MKIDYLKSFLMSWLKKELAILDEKKIVEIKEEDRRELE